MTTPPNGTVRAGINGGYEYPLAVRPDLWPRFSLHADALALLAIAQAAFPRNDLQIIDETGAAENGQISIPPQSDARIWTIKGSVTTLTGSKVLIDDWAGDVWDRRAQPSWWEDRNPNAGYTPAGGPYLSIRVDISAGFDPANAIPDGELIWQAAPFQG